MHIASTGISLNVADPQASADFLSRHIGYSVAMQDDGFLSLSHPEAPNIIFLRTGLPSFKPVSHAASARDGLIIAFVVDDVDAEFGRMQRDGAEVVTLPETEPWGERYCQFRDPNDLIVQLVTWVPTPDDHS
jgi:catechol 2,3-dioxygenase-like lactoylglutathione lyase family enzyme